MAAPQLTFIPSQQSNGGGSLIPMDEIPQDVKVQAEEIFTALQQHSGSMEAHFPTVQELLTYEKQLRSYGEQRMVDGKPAPIFYRRSPWKDRPETAIRFRITDTPQKNKATADGINAAVDKVKAAAKK